MKKFIVIFLLIVLLIPSMALASDFKQVTSADDADHNMGIAYNQVLIFIRWFIILRATIDISTTVSNGDFAKAKNSAIGYTTIYIIIRAIPVVTTWIDSMFNGMRGW